MLKFDCQTVLIGNVNIERKVKEIIDKKSQKEEEREKKMRGKRRKGEKGRLGKGKEKRGQSNK